MVKSNQMAGREKKRESVAAAVALDASDLHDERIAFTTFSPTSTNPSTAIELRIRGGGGNDDDDVIFLSSPNTNGATGIATADAAGTATNTSTSKRKVVATVTTIEENHKLRDFVTNTHDCYKVPPLTFYQWLLDNDIESLDNLCEACYEEEFVDTEMRMQGGLRLFKKRNFFKALMEAAPKAAAAAGAAATPPQRATTNGSTFASMVLAATTMPHTSTGGDSLVDNEQTRKYAEATAYAYSEVTTSARTPSARFFRTEAVAILNAWFFSNPYPTKSEKIQLMEQTGLDEKQIVNWFKKNRSRYASENSDSNVAEPPESSRGRDAEDNHDRNSIVAKRPESSSNVKIANDEIVIGSVDRGAGQHTTTAAFATGAGAVPAAMFSFGGNTKTPPVKTTKGTTKKRKREAKLEDETGFDSSKLMPEAPPKRKKMIVDQTKIEEIWELVREIAPYALRTRTSVANTKREVALVQKIRKRIANTKREIALVKQRKQKNRKYFVNRYAVKFDPKEEENNTIVEVIPESHPDAIAKASATNTTTSLNIAPAEHDHNFRQVGGTLPVTEEVRQAFTTGHAIGTVTTLDNYYNGINPANFHTMRTVSRHLPPNLAGGIHRWGLVPLQSKLKSSEQEHVWMGALHALCWMAAYVIKNHPELLQGNNTLVCIVIPSGDERLDLFHQFGAPGRYKDYVNPVKSPFIVPVFAKDTVAFPANWIPHFLANAPHHPTVVPLLTEEQKRERRLARVEANREQGRAYQRSYNEANRERRRAYQRSYNEANRERQRSYYEANRERRRSYYEANRERRLAYQRSYRRR